MLYDKVEQQKYSNALQGENCLGCIAKKYDQMNHKCLHAVQRIKMHFRDSPQNFRQKFITNPVTFQSKSGDSSKATIHKLHILQHRHKIFSANTIQREAFLSIEQNNSNVKQPTLRI